MADYTADAADALATIQEEGAQFAISRDDGRTLDPVAGSYTGGTPLTGNLWAVLLPGASPFMSKQAESQYAEDLIRGTVKILLAAASGAPYEPRAGDTITLSDGDYNVLGSTSLKPDDVTPILYNIILKKISA